MTKIVKIAIHFSLYIARSVFCVATLVANLKGSDYNLKGLIKSPQLFSFFFRIELQFVV